MQCKSFALLTIHFLLLQTISSHAEDINFYADENEYAVEVLQHILTYSPTKNYNVIAYTEDIAKDRAFSMMRKKRLLDVVFGGATNKRLTENQAIEIPILKGLNGWRIPVVTSKNKELFKKLTSVENFKKLKPGLFHRWSDTEIMIEPSSIIYYPTAYYFYVSKENKPLAADIKKGLLLASADGSLDLMFEQHFGDIVKRIRQQKRKVYTLTNPLLPSTTPLNQKQFWIELSPLK